MLDLAGLLAVRDGAACAGWRGDASVSVDALRARVNAWRALAMRTPGRAVALYLTDSLEFSAALLGAWLAAKTVWLSADTVPASWAALARSVDAFFGEFPAAYAPQLPAMTDHCAQPWNAIAPSFAALVVHTSGSTGAAQAIPKQYAQLVSEVATLEQLFGAALGRADVIATVSHQHIYGLLFKVLWPLAAGRAVHAVSLTYPEQLAALLARAPCVLVASPAHLKRLPEHLDWRAASAALRAVFSSGGPLAPEAAALSARLLGQTPTEIYGSSESGGIAWRRRAPGDAGSWEAMPGVAWRVSATGARLEVRSAHLPDDAWFAMEDRVSGAANGRFLLLGRADRLVKVEEKRVSLDAIEAALVASGLAQQARVILPPEASGERQALAAFVVLSDEGRALLASAGRRALSDALRARLAGSVEAVAMPRRWRYLEQLPVDAQGKTTHALLLAQLGMDAAVTRPRLPHMAVVEQGADRVLLSVNAPADLFYFEGHFTDTPILPGVVQLDWAIHYARVHFTLAPAFAGMQALKFQQVIRPDEPVTLELLHDAVKSSINFRYFSRAGQHASGRIMFGTPQKASC